MSYAEGTIESIEDNEYRCLCGWWFGTFCIFHNIWDNPSHWLSYLSRWLKPPTSYYICVLPANFMFTNCYAPYMPEFQRPFFSPHGLHQTRTYPNHPPTIHHSLHVAETKKTGWRDGSLSEKKVPSAVGVELMSCMAEAMSIFVKQGLTSNFMVLSYLSICVSIFLSINLSIYLSNLI